ncbi:MAG: DUF1853 family protein [Rubritalea sp.]|uniref:DUF1853 family protein n=1 Tax=Rubritalea sp. TaxID=2109375 RepID=UPI003241EBF2
MQYHPTQKIAKEHEHLFSNAILESLTHPQSMVGTLPNSSCFEVSSLANSPNTRLLRFNQKLGHLYEDALFSLLEAGTRFKCVAKNYQIITPEKRTIGELDFILLDTLKQQYIHLELAVKFYLIQHSEGSFYYPGPDARDNYQRKVTRLNDHQLTLSNRPEAAEFLAKLTGGGPLEVKHLVHGIFFDHITAKQKPIPECASPQSRRRSWLYCSELLQHHPEIETARVLPKQLWLCEIDAIIFDTLVVIPASELIELGQKRCTMFVIHVGDEPKFLVPNNWPSIN